MKLKGKVAIITGAGSGIGKAISILFSGEGAKIIIAEVNDKTGRKTADEITKFNGVAHFVKTDVTKYTDIQKLVNFVESKYGRLDVLINNAGIYLLSTVDKMSEMNWDKLIATNLKGPFLCSKYSIPLIKKTGGGTIINISSGLGLVPEAETPAYCASKAGLIMLTKSMALAHAKDNIRVNAICPGPIDTPLLRAAFSEKEMKKYAKTTILGKIGKPADVAKVALFLASDDSSYVTGAAYTVDGGESIR